MAYTKTGHKDKMIPVQGIGIYKGTKTYWESMNYCSQCLGVSAYTIKRHIDSGKPINGFILSKAEGKPLKPTN